MAFTQPCFFEAKLDQPSQIEKDVMEKGECPKILYVDHELDVTLKDEVYENQHLIRVQL